MIDARSTNDTPVLTFDGVSKTFKKTTALRDVTVAIPRGAIVGLIGRNGCGKTTLLHHATGLLLPTSGACRTFGVATADLGGAQHARMGVVHQHARLLGWMRVSQLISYVGSFYETWDGAMVASLTDRLHLDPRAKVSSLSPGTLQALSLLLALSHNPELLLLDEPLSDLDPTARREVAALLLEYYATRECTMVISSHLLHDIEPMVNRILCLDAGRVTANEELDALKETYEEWIVTARGDALPRAWHGVEVVRVDGDARQARLIVRGTAVERQAQAASLSVQHDLDIAYRALGLEQLFPILTARGGTAAMQTEGDHAHR